MIELIAILTLGIICIGQFIFMLFYTKSLLKQMDDAIKAVLSKSVNEYVIAKNMENKSEINKGESELVELAEADEDTFDKFIKTQ